MSSPDISIGMPVYNGERFLKEALDSLLGQNHANLELVISDNASSDRTEAICREYAERDKRIRYFRQPVNIGAARNFAFVLQAAKGEFFSWAACDDLWDPNWFSTLLASMRDQEHVFAFGRLRFVDATGSTVIHIANGRTFHFGASKGWSRQLRFYFDPEGLGKANIIYGLYRRREIDQVGLKLLDQDFADVVFLFRQLGTSRLIQTPGATMHKRLHEWSVAQQGYAVGVTTPWRSVKGAIRAFIALPRRYAAQARGGLAVIMLVAAPLKGILYLIGSMRARLSLRAK